MQKNNFTLCSKGRLYNEIYPKFSSMNSCFDRPAVISHIATEAVECMCVNVTLF